MMTSFRLFSIRARFVGCLMALFLLGQRLNAQKTFAFNAPGNECYFHYICYAPNNDYASRKRPYFFVMGREGEDAQLNFDLDTLKNNPLFYNYLFVYLPNRGEAASEKLHCVEALEDLVTFNFTLGKGNRFLRLYDPGIHAEDVAKLNLGRSFKTVKVQTDTVPAISDFKEDLSTYDDPEDNGGKDKNKESYATFYEEEPEAADATPEATKSLRTYFGPALNHKFTLTGSIRDKATGEALPFANIIVKGTNIAATSNADGLFTLLKVPSDTSTLLVHYIGYDKTEIFLTPQLPKNNLTIQLSNSNQLKGVTIRGAKEDVVLINKTEVGVIKMTPKKLEQLPNIGERDVMRSFQLMPGVSASNESSSGLYVRGGTPDQNLVLFDGFTVYQVDHLYGFFSAFNSNALKDVQLYKGGFESKFGGRLSSVTELTSKDGNQNKFNIGADVSFLSFNVFAEIPIGKKFSSVIAFRRSYKGFLYDKIFKKFSSSSTTTTQAGPGGRRSQNATVSSFFYDLNGKFTYRPTAKDVISLSIFNGTDKLDNSNASSGSRFGNANSSFSFNTTDLTKYGNVGASLRWARKLSEKLYGTTIASYSNYFSDRDRSQERTIIDSAGTSTSVKDGILETNDLKDFSLKSDYQWNLFNFMQIQFGVFGTYFDIRYTYAQNDTSTILNKKNQAFLGGGYVQSRFKFLKDKLQITPGIRTSYFQTTGQLYYEPRASFSYSLSKRFSLKGATGKYYQFANRVTREDILTGSKDFWLLSDGKSVPVSSAIHYIAGVSYETNDYLFSTEGYYKTLSNVTEYSLRFNSSPLGINYNENFYTGTGFSKGIEFLVQRKTGKLNGWVSYTLGQARSFFSVYSDTYFPSNQDVTHEFKIVLLYKYKRWDFSATWIYATGRPYTAPSGAYTVTLLDGSTQSYFTVTSKNSLRLPDYHRMDVSANYKLLGGMKGNKRRREIGYIGFSIFNVYNRTNVWYKTFTIQNGSILETNVNYLGIVPNLTLSLKLR